MNARVTRRKNRIPVRCTTGKVSVGCMRLAERPIEPLTCARASGARVPSTANIAFGSQAARSGGITPLPPMAFVSWIMRRKIIVVARLTPIPYAEPPRCVLVARGAPNSAMMMHVIGMAILSARSTREQVRVAAGALERA